MKTIRIPARLWYDNEERELSFPERWQVDNLTSLGLEKPGLTPQQIEERMNNPIDGLPLLELPPGARASCYRF